MTLGQVIERLNQLQEIHPNMKNALLLDSENLDFTIGTIEYDSELDEIVISFVGTH